MNENHLHHRATKFLTEHITSVSQLELLLLLRTNLQSEWTVRDLARELRVDEAWATAQLGIFVEQGVVSVASPLKFSYQPANKELEQDVAAVAQAYLVNRVSVIEFIYGRPNQSMRAFADAFRVRKSPPHG